MFNVFEFLIFRIFSFPLYDLIPAAFIHSWRMALYINFIYLLVYVLSVQEYSLKCSRLKLSKTEMAQHLLLGDT